jgi:type IV pilus assembly protein PilN
VILINLLPHREEKRKRARRSPSSPASAWRAAGAGDRRLWYLVVQQHDHGAAGAQRVPDGRDRKLDKCRSRTSRLEGRDRWLKARQKAVEDLQIDRNMPVHVLNELVKQTPEGMYFTTVKQDGQVLTVTGIAQTNERVSEFLRNTGLQLGMAGQARAGRNQGATCRRRTRSRSACSTSRCA